MARTPTYLLSPLRLSGFDPTNSNHLSQMESWAGRHLRNPNLSPGLRSKLQSVANRAGQLRRFRASPAGSLKAHVPAAPHAQPPPVQASVSQALGGVPNPVQERQPPAPPPDPDAM